jgi:hypothetical protein
VIPSRGGPPCNSPRHADTTPRLGRPATDRRARHHVLERGRGLRGADEDGFDLRAFVEAHFALPDESGITPPENQSLREHIEWLWPALTRSTTTYLPQLQREHAFWMAGLTGTAPGGANERVVVLPDGTVLNRYWDARDTPRPQAYAIDVRTAASAEGRTPSDVYRDLRAAAESGIDFSSRWLGDGRTLATIRTTSIIPVDLNSLLFHLENTITRACRQLHDRACVRSFREQAGERGPVSLPRHPMIPFPTTSEQKLKLAAYVVEMVKAGLDHRFIVSASELARVDQGIYDLFELWSQSEHDASEREQIIADIQDLLEEHQDSPKEPEQKPYIRFDQLDDVAQRVMAEKATLRQLIDKHGGVSVVAQKSGIPQPSLSRMLNSPSIPRRSTLYKIANALDLPETDIAFEWTR